MYSQFVLLIEGISKVLMNGLDFSALSLAVKG